MDNDLLKEFGLDRIDSTWVPFFELEIKKEYFFPLLIKLKQEYQNKCWPRKEHIFRLFQEIPVNKVKVVILGQDPYHLPNVADGIAFSTQKERYIPASLKNIFRELKNDLSCSLPTKGDLLPWVKEGVFLLNTALSVRDGQALSHMKLWEEFIYSLLIYLNNYNKQIIWVFWGQKARKIGEQCGIQTVNNQILVSAHPSPYSAEAGFSGSRPFSKVNQLLLKLEKEPIKWEKIC